jgi:asparagine synthase (glutamine-hydrolysing)
MEGILPEAVLYRKKSPYPKTWDPGYYDLVSEALKNLLQDRNAPLWQIVNHKTAQDLLTAEYAWPWYGQLMKVPQTIAYLLQVNFWLKEYKISVT